MRAIVLSLLLCVAGPALAQARTWEAMSQPARIAYVQGLVDGRDWGLTAALIDKCGGDGKCMGESMRRLAMEGRGATLRRLPTALMVDEVDAFYREPRNRPINVYTALDYIALRVAGTPAEELKSILDGFQRAFPPQPGNR